MKAKNALTAMVVALGVSFLLAGCFGESSASYAKRCIEKSHELQKYGEGFGNELKPWFEGKQVDAAKAAAEFKKTQDLVAKLKTEVLGFTVPSATTAQTFATQMKQYLEYEEKIIGQMGELVIGAIQKENPGSEELRMVTAQKLQDIVKEENQWLAKLNKAAGDCGLTIIANK